MEIVSGIENLLFDKNSVLTVGTFDGIHIGHRNIFKDVERVAALKSARSIILTFEPHPRTVVSKDYKIKLLTTFEEKVELLAQSKIDVLLLVEFNEKFSKQSSEEFVKNCLVDNIGISHFVIGHDHKFGKNRDGDEKTLRELGSKYGFDVSAVPPVNVDGEIVSSTKIRNFLQEGDPEAAAKLLGRNYSFSGKVVEGATRGKILGFPTANIEVTDSNKLIPKNGVYIVECLVGGDVVFGVMNIGVRPTFVSEGDLVIEVHLFDFNKNIYGEKIEVNCIKRLRDERKFDSKEELIYQIASDKKKAIQYIGKLIN